jgi:hypothetical protein
MLPRQRIAAAQIGPCRSITTRPASDLAAACAVATLGLARRPI